MIVIETVCCCHCRRRRCQRLIQIRGIKIRCRFCLSFTGGGYVCTAYYCFYLFMFFFAAAAALLTLLLLVHTLYEWMIWKGNLRQLLRNWYRINRNALFLLLICFASWTIELFVWWRRVRDWVCACGRLSNFFVFHLVCVLWMLLFCLPAKPSPTKSKYA